MAYLSREELLALGLRALGEDVRISRKASLYNCAQIAIGSHVRIDDFCILSAGAGGISLGSYIHIGAYTSLIGGGSITLHDFANVSSRVSVFSHIDDFSGESMTSPLVPAAFKCLQEGPVVIGRQVMIGCGSVIMPGVTLHEGAAVGALSFVKSDCAAFTVNVGSPARRLAKMRSRAVLDQERAFLAGQAP